MVRSVKAHFRVRLYVLLGFEFRTFVFYTHFSVVVSLLRYELRPVSNLSLKLEKVDVEFVCMSVHELLCLFFFVMLVELF